eukprot:7102264-Prymnesium_polylepis.1
MRLLYIHTEKTGGSSIECAVQTTLERAGLWVNMGHNDAAHVQQCAAACSEMQSLVVLSVREPYSYWASVYGYALAGVGTAVHPCPGRGPNRDCWVLQSFDVFLKWVSDDYWSRKLSQTLRVQRACGNPCVYDALLRTENLVDDWTSLLAGLRIPPIRLPRLNGGQASPVHPSSMTREQLDLVNRIDHWIFEEFGYTKR